MASIMLIAYDDDDDASDNESKLITTMLKYETLIWFTTNFY